MAICKRKTKGCFKYQVKLKGVDGLWISVTFDRLDDARRKEAELKSIKANGRMLTGQGRRITLNEYFTLWFRHTAEGSTSKGWRYSQEQMYFSYVATVIGEVRLQAINTACIERVLNQTRQLGRSTQMQRHVYNLLHKIFEDAVEHHEILTRNPVKKSIKPKVIAKPSTFLTFEQAKRLLWYVRNRPHGIAIWLQVLGGLRAGEVQALKWDSVDLENRLITVRSTYARKEKVFRAHTKGKKIYQVGVPLELALFLEETMQRSTGEYVAGTPKQHMCYQAYVKSLKGYLTDLLLPNASTHSLRHTSTIVYREFGAVRDDIHALLGHAKSNDVTDRYDHAKGQNLFKVAKVIRLFPDCGEVSPEFPKRGNDGEIIGQLEGSRYLE